MYEKKNDRYKDTIESMKQILKASKKESKYTKKHKTYKDKNGSIRTVVVEIKPKNQVQMPEQNPKRRTKSWAYKVQTWVVNQAKWEAAKEFCADRNYEFRIMTEEDLGI